jgi:hypothetical protein
MSPKLERRLSRLEAYALRTTEKPLVCNCREATRFHNSACLYELLKKMPRVCPVHGFRELGFFLWVPPEVRLIPDDSQFCPCFANPWRAFFEGPGPHTLEGLHAVVDALRKRPEAYPPDLEEDYRQAATLMDEYDAAFQLWIRKSSQKSVSGRERAKAQRQAVRKHEELVSQVRREYLEQLDARRLA